MSGKFMRVKRIVIPTITMVVIASQLMGCSAASPNELMTMVQNSDSIEIEIAEPINQEQGEQEQLDWIELALLTDNEKLRDGWDHALNIDKIENGKNGMVYVDKDGNQVNNNTLYIALHNRQFQKAIETGSSVYSELANSAESNYADLEIVSDEDKANAVLMGINGYFNLLPDSSPNYSNPDSTIERNEFMAMMYRANTPVQELKEDVAFTNAVGQNDYNVYAQNMAGSSYLDIGSKSLDNLTYNGTITRAEAIYSIVNTYFSDEYKNVDVSQAAYSDCKNGGDIIQKVVDKDKKINSLSEVEHWKAYELTYSLQNPDSLGMPTNLYKAMIVAKQKNLIDGNVSRWDEGLTKVEAIDMIVRAIKQDDSMETFDLVRAAIEVVDEVEEAVKAYDEEIEKALNESVPQDIDEDNIIDEAYVTEEEFQAESTDTFTVTPLDKTMYTIKACNVREKPSTNDKVLDCLDKATEVKVTGKVNEAEWYEVSIGNQKGYISTSLLSDTKPAEQAPSTPNNDTGNTSNGTDTPAPAQPSETTNPPDENGSYMDENGLWHLINPATGDYYKDGDTTPQGWTYGTI